MPSNFKGGFCMRADHNVFIEAVSKQRKVYLTYIERENGLSESSLMVPIDYSLGIVEKDGCDCYHFWDFKKGFSAFPVVLSSDQIVSMEMTAEEFKPEEFVTWDLQQMPWFYPRNWGRFS
jgi:hypothetical protein